MSNELIKCLHCKWTRKAENKDYIGCAASLATDKLDYTNNEDLLNFYDRDEVAIGWVNLHYYPDGTTWLGMITSGIPCFKRDDSCKHFGLREERKNV